MVPDGDAYVEALLYLQSMAIFALCVRLLYFTSVMEEKWWGKTNKNAVIRVCKSFKHLRYQKVVTYEQPPKIILILYQSFTKSKYNDLKLSAKEILRHLWNRIWELDDERKVVKGVGMCGPENTDFYMILLLTVEVVPKNAGHLTITKIPNESRSRFTLKRCELARGATATFYLTISSNTPSASPGEQQET